MVGSQGLTKRVLMPGRNFSFPCIPVLLIFFLGGDSFRISNINWGERYEVLNFTHLYKYLSLPMVNIYYQSSQQQFMKVIDMASSPIIYI